MSIDPFMKISLTFPFLIIDVYNVCWLLASNSLDLVFTSMGRSSSHNLKIVTRPLSRNPATASVSPDDKLSPSQRRLWHIRHQTVWRLSGGDGQVFIVYDPLKGWEIGDGVMRCNIGATSIKYAVVRFTTRTGGCCLAVWKWIRRFFVSIERQPMIERFHWNKWTVLFMQYLQN